MTRTTDIIFDDSADPEEREKVLARIMRRDGVSRETAEAVLREAVAEIERMRDA